MMKTLLSTKTKAVPFHEPIHFLPSLKWKGSSNFLANPFESSSGNLGALRFELRMLSENTFLEAIVETGRIPFISLDIPSVETFESGHGFAPPRYDHSPSLFGFTNQRSCLVLKVPHGGELGHESLLNVATKIATLKDRVNQLAEPPRRFHLC